LQVHVDGMAAAAKHNDLAEYYKQDLEFHRAIWRLSGNRYIVQFLENSVPPLFTFYVNHIQRTAVQLVGDAQRHQQILDNIRTEDAERARAFLEKVIVQYFWR
jgi:DNA-binding GntR family transcriptional regulator